MKKHLLIAGLICVATIPPASAVTKCVKQPSSSQVFSDVIGIVRQSDWFATYDGVQIHGIGFCGSQYGVSVGQTTDTVKTSSSNDANKYCWCRMISPAVSQWVFYSEYESHRVCASDCAQYCAYYGLTFAAFRSALFSNLSD